MTKQHNHGMENNCTIEPLQSSSFKFDSYAWKNTHETKHAKSDICLSACFTVHTSIYMIKNKVKQCMLWMCVQCCTVTGWSMMGWGGVRAGGVVWGLPLCCGSLNSCEGHQPLATPAGHIKEKRMPGGRPVERQVQYDHKQDCIAAEFLSLSSFL